MPSPLFPAPLLLLLLLALSATAHDAPSPTSCGPISVCIWSNSRSRNYHLSTVLRRALQHHCNPCISLVSTLSLCRSTTAAIYFDPYYDPPTSLIRTLLSRSVQVFRIAVGPHPPHHRRHRITTYKVRSHRLALRQIPPIASSICNDLRRPSPSPSPSPTPSPPAVLPDFKRRRVPSFNLDRLETLFDTLFNLDKDIITGNIDIDLEAQLVRFPDPTPSPSPSPPKHKRHWATWRVFQNGSPQRGKTVKTMGRGPSSVVMSAVSRQQVVQMCGRSNCAARVTLTSRQFLRRQIVTRALRIIRQRPSFNDVFETNTSFFTVRRVGNRRFVVTIPFKEVYLAEF